MGLECRGGGLWGTQGEACEGRTRAGELTAALGAALGGSTVRRGGECREVRAGWGLWARMGLDFIPVIFQGSREIYVFPYPVATVGRLRSVWQE